jgi:hypothetical protein
VIDSDGYIGVHKRGSARGWADSYQPRVQVKQVEDAAIRLLHDALGGYIGTEQPLDRRRLWVWCATSAAAGRALTAVLPFLRIKRAQAENALLACDLNAQRGRRRFQPPPVIPGEPLVTASEAAVAVGVTYESVCQAARKGSVPYVRQGRRIFIPESFLAVWAERGSTPRRTAEVTEALNECYERSRALNGTAVT